MDTRNVVVTIKGGTQQAKTPIEAKQYSKMDKLQNVAKFFETAQGDPATTYVVGQTINVVNEAVSFAASNIGNWTGDIGAVHTAQAFQIATSTAKQMFNMGFKAHLGAKAFAWGAALEEGATQASVDAAAALGMFVGGGFALVSAGISAGKKLYEFNVGTAATERGVMFNKARAGALLNNWSR